jgi:hypothetical protein
MDFEEPITKKRSLGALRRAEKTKPKSPDLTGQLRLQRHTVEIIVKQFQETDAEEVICCIAGWHNGGHQGSYLTVELSPRYVSRRFEPTKPNLVDFICDDAEQPIQRSARYK